MKPSILYVDESTIENDRVDSHFYHSKYISNEKSLKKSGLKIETLGEVISKMNSPIGWQGIPSAAYLPKGIGVPLIRVQNVSDLMLDKDTLIDVQEYIYQEQPAIQAEAEDIIITRVGTIGRVCRIPQDIDKIAMGQNLTRIKVDTNIISSEFLTIFLASEYCQLQMKRYAYGGVQPSLTNKNIKQLLIPIPSPEIQKYIGDKVRRAEELREEAKRLKEEALSQFQQIYTSDVTSTYKFDWIKSQLLDALNSSPVFYKQYDLLEDKKNNYIEFNDVISNIKCGVPVKKTDREGENHPFYGASGATDKIGSYNFDGEYLIVAQDGSIGCANVARGKFWANNHVWVVQLKEKWDLEFVELYLKNYNYWPSLTTGSVVPKVTAENLRKLLIPEIDYDLQFSIGELIRKSKSNIETSKQLIQQAKQDVEDLIEGNFDTSKLNDDTTTESR